MFFYNWQLAISLFWVVPVTFIIILLSKRRQLKYNRFIYDKKRAVSEKSQEIKSYDNEEKYLSELNTKLDDYETNLTRGELFTGVLVNSAQSVLKLGIATVILVGAYLLTRDRLDLLPTLCFSS